MSAGPSGDAPRIYRRSLGTRLLSVGAALLFLAAALSGLRFSGVGPAFVVCGVLALLGLANVVTAWGDRYTLGDDGIEYRNVLLARLGLHPRRLAWSEVDQVLEHTRPPRGRRDRQPHAVLLVPRSGRRLVLDSLEHFDEVLRTVRSRCAGRTPAPGVPSPAGGSRSRQ